MTPPVIGITSGNKDDTAQSGRYESWIGYSRCVAQVGGVPVLLPHEPTFIGQYVAMCDGLILTGGSDPDTTAFGEAVHPKARVMDPQRQAFEVGLLEAWARAKPQAAVLGVCLGMQLMALYAGGKLNQYLPDTLGDADAAVHLDYKRHALELCVSDSAMGNQIDQTVVSSHQQAVADAGTMRTIARTADGVIEAIDDPARKFYVGVQWHPERGGDEPFSRGLIARFVQAAGLCTS